jgi:hypothetical protein
MGLLWLPGCKPAAVTQTGECAMPTVPQQGEAGCTKREIIKKIIGSFSSPALPFFILSDHDNNRDRCNHKDDSCGQYDIRSLQTPDFFE